MSMKAKAKDIDPRVIAPEPTIWALRKNPHNGNSPKGNDHSLYEHIFGYDPISLLRSPDRPSEDKAGATSAANPQLNIINPETNFAVMELVSEDPEEFKY